MSRLENEPLGHNLFLFPAGHNKTEVNVKRTSRADVYQLDESQQTVIDASDPDNYVSIDATKPVAVLQYLVTHVLQGDCASGGGGGGETPSGRCHPSLLVVPPMEQREHQYLFSTGDAASGKQNVNLVIATPLKDGVLLDGGDLMSYINHAGRGDSLSAPTWKNIDNPSNVSYSAIRFLLDKGLHKITHNSAKAEFSATAFGHPSSVADSHSPSQSLFQPANTNDSEDASWAAQNNTSSGIQVEESQARDEINDEYLSDSSPWQTKGSSSSVIAVVITLFSAVLFVAICIAGFVLKEYAFHNGEKSIFRSAKVSPYEPID